MRAALLATLLGVSVVACVDGTTPDCSTPASGCFPGDAAAQPDSNGDASGATDAADADAGPPADAALD